MRPIATLMLPYVLRSTPRPELHAYGTTERDRRGSNPRPSQGHDPILLVMVLREVSSSYSEYSA